MPQAPVHVGVVYEDGQRTEKLLKELHKRLVDTQLTNLIELTPLDLDSRSNCIVALPVSTPPTNTSDMVNVILSRFSGSSFYRDNSELQDMSLLLMGNQNAEQVGLINGLSVIQLENSKPLQLAKLTSATFTSSLTSMCQNNVRLPDTVLVRSLTSTGLEKAVGEIARGRCLYSAKTVSMPVRQIVLKPAYGGGSRGVHLVDWTRLQQTGQLGECVKACTGAGAVEGRAWLVQRCVGEANKQVRVEVVNSKVLYAVAITKADKADQDNDGELPWHEAQNLCLCEVSDDVSLSIHPTAASLAAELGCSMQLCVLLFEYAQKASVFLEAPVLAMEFKLDGDIGYMIDLNLQSNYNFAAEEATAAQIPGFVGAGVNYLQLFVRLAKKNKQAQESIEAWVMSRGQASYDLTNPETFHPQAILLLNETLVDSPTMAQHVGDLQTWSLQKEELSTDTLEKVSTFVSGLTRAVVWYDPFYASVTRLTVHPGGLWGPE